MKKESSYRRRGLMGSVSMSIVSSKFGAGTSHFAGLRGDTGALNDLTFSLNTNHQKQRAPKK